MNNQTQQSIQFAHLITHLLRIEYVWGMSRLCHLALFLLVVGVLDVSSQNFLDNIPIQRDVGNSVNTDSTLQLLKECYVDFVVDSASSDKRNVFKVKTLGSDYQDSITFEFISFKVKTHC